MAVELLQLWAAALMVGALGFALARRSRRLAVVAAVLIGTLGAWQVSVLWHPIGGMALPSLAPPGFVHSLWAAPLVALILTALGAGRRASARGRTRAIRGERRRTH